MKRILIVGDVIVDRYTYGKKRGISAETPTIVAEYQSHRYYMGGAALVARHLLRLGHDVTLVTVADTNGSSIRQQFKYSDDAPTDDEMDRLRAWVPEYLNWNLTSKHRYFVDTYKMLQIDSLNKGTWTPEQEHEFACEIESRLDNMDALLFCDNRHGVMSRKIIRDVSLAAHTKKIPIYVDSQVSQAESNIEEYAGCTYAFMNERELDCVISSRGLTRQERIVKAEEHLNCSVILKLGDEGSMSSEVVEPTRRVSARDTCGAGDAYLAAFVSSDHDMKFANWWATRSTLYYGTEIPPREEPHQ